MSELAMWIVREHGSSDCIGGRVDTAAWCCCAPEGEPLCDACERLYQSILALLVQRTQALDQLQAENEALKLGRYHGPLDTREQLLHRRCQRAESDVSRLLARERAAQDALTEMTARMVAAVEARERYALEVRNLQAADAARVSRTITKRWHTMGYWVYSCGCIQYHQDGSERCDAHKAALPTI